MNKPVIVYGNRSLAQMLLMDSRNSSDFQIVAFAVDREFLNDNRMFCGLIQICLEDIEKLYPPHFYDLIVVDGTNILKTKDPLINKVKDKGYTFRNYISPNSIVSPDLIMGYNNIVFEQAYIGQNGKLGNNNLIRQQVYLGHDFIIGDNNVFNPGVKVGGFLKCKSEVFVGLNSTVIDHIHLENKSIIGAGSLVLKDTEENSLNLGNPSKNAKGDKNVSTK
ncbi:MAG TPA: hypothetical protein VFH18_02075 [Erysipelotrichaceae bacterium]|nr:hypothetical protein [Erysipelotrichaceae bacterium]